MGIPFQYPGFEDRICIVQKDKFQDALALRDEAQKDKRSLKEDEIRPYGHQVFDINAIKRVCDLSELRGVKVKGDLGVDVRPSRKTYIFGAGASAWCVHGDEAKGYREHQCSMPLGVELFDRKYRDFRKKYKGADLSVTEINSRARDVEQCLNDEWISFKAYRPDVAARHVNIQFYMQELFTELSKTLANADHFDNRLYHLFARKLNKHLHGNTGLSKDEKVVNLITFNYDTLLEDALNDYFTEHPIQGMDSYCDAVDKKVDVFKPHGSCNWGWPFRNEEIKAMPAKEVIDQLLAKNITPYDLYFGLLGYGQDAIAQNSWGLEAGNSPNGLGRFALNRDLIEVIPPNAKEAYVPALLIPYRDKDELVMPYRHQAVMNTALGHTEELIIIGWKGNERVFNHRLKKEATAVKKITIVDPDPMTVIAHLERDLGIPSLGEKYELDTSIRTFEEYVVGHMDEHLKA